MSKPVPRRGIKKTDLLLIFPAVLGFDAMWWIIFGAPAIGVPYDVERGSVGAGLAFACLLAWCFSEV